MSDKLGLELSRVLFANEPLLLSCDVEASARSAAAVSNLLGCIMATILERKPETYEAAMRAVVTNIHNSAVRTADRAQHISENEPPGAMQ